MKKAILTLLLLTSNSAPYAHAATEQKIEEKIADKQDSDREEFHRKGKRFGPCNDISLTSEQEKALQNDRFKFESQRIDLEAKVKHARLNLDKVLNDEKSTAKEATLASQELATAIATLIGSEEQFKTDLVFKNFKANQRKQALHCEFVSRGGPGGEHGPGGERGPHGPPPPPEE